MKMILSTLLGWGLLAAPLRALEPGQGVVVRFRDGGSVAGVLVETGPDETVIDVAGGRTAWPAASIARLEPQRTSLEIFREKRAACRTREDLLSLARWAEEAGLNTERERLAAELGLPPDIQAPPPEPPAPPQNFQVLPLPRAGEGWGEGAEPAAVVPAGTTGLPFGRPTGPAFVPVYSYVPVLYAPPPRDTRAQRAAYLKELGRRREAWKHTPSTPVMDFQFRLQETLDRRAHGLPFAAKPL